MSKNILIFGAFGYRNNHLDGQTIKTRSVYDLLKQRYDGNVDYFDTQGMRQKPYLLITALSKLLKCDRLILMQASASLTYTLPFFYFLSKISQFKLIWLCIGGWQVDYFEGWNGYDKHPYQLKITKKIYQILPELKKVDNDLKSMYQITHTEYFPNFRKFDMLKQVSDCFGQLKIVFMARVHKLKGYDIIFQFSELAKYENLDVCIDFYGQINLEDETDFMSKISNHSNTTYKGYLKPEEIQSTLHQYDVLVLPTRYYTEGIPGTIIDAYIAGIPVIVTNWKHAHEIVNDEQCGFIVSFDNPQDEFNRRLIQLYQNRDELIQMKKNALHESHKYSEDAAWNILKKYL